MKKIMMTLAAVAVAATMNAQVWVGGELGISTTKDKVERGGVSTDYNATNFTFAPELGYNLDEKWSVAIKLGFAHNEADADAQNLVSDFLPINGKLMTNSFSIKPYVRYTFVKAGNFSAFVDGGISYSSVHVNNLSKVINNINAFGVSVNPGISYAVSEKVGLVAHIGDLSYNTMWCKAKDVDVKVSKSGFNLGLWNSISFGAYYNF